MKLTGTAVIALAGVGLAGALGLWMWRRGGVVNAAGAAVSGTVDAVSQAVGLPTTSQTTTDAEAARWIIDNIGRFEASKWAGAPAFLSALLMPAGSGKAPPADSPAGRALLPLVATYDETDRLLARYPNHTAADAIYSGNPSPGLTVGESFGFPL